MNLILFEPTETDRPLSRKDRRSIHIVDVLRRRVGDSFAVGLIDGPRGKATLDAITPDNLALTFTWSVPPNAPAPIALIVGLPRPQTARDILRDATTLGIASIHFVRTAKSDSSYGQSTLWTSGEWRRHLIAGAEQAFDTRLPEVRYTGNLSDVISSLDSSSVRLALDNYESSIRMGDFNAQSGNSHVLAVGGERGWSAADRDVLRDHHFTFVHLGPRVLRTETAVVAALSILRMKRGLM